MKKLELTKMSSFTCNVLGMIISIIIAFGFSLPFGIGYAIDWVTDLILYTVIIEVALDLVAKLKEEKSRICWEYLCGLVLLLLTDWGFMFTAHQTENNPFFICGTVTIFLAVASFVWFKLLVSKGYKRKLEA